MATFKHLAAIASILTLVSACAQSTNKDKQVSPVEERSGLTDTRICTDKVTNVTNSSLGGFFGLVVRGLEGNVTYCLELSGSGTSVESKFRIEYEDDFGIRYYQTQESDTYFGEIKTVDDVVKIHVIMIDNAGFIEIKGSSHIDDILTNATVRYHNFPSYEEALNLAVLEAQTNCQNGTYTVAQCLGYNFPNTFWWNQPFPGTPQQQMLDLAKETLADTTKSKQLGKIAFDLGLTLTQ